jgi:hypothetical protein
MAVRLRINLRINGESIRTLDDLRDHFNIDEVLDFLRDGRLVRWLEDKDTDLTERVKAINGDDLHCAKSLCDIFDVTYDESDLRLMVLQYTDKKEQNTHRETIDGKSEQDIIKGYFTRFNNIIEKILDHNQDYDYLKVQIDHLFTEYPELTRYSGLSRHYKPSEWFDKSNNALELLLEDAPLALLAAVSSRKLKTRFNNDFQKRLYDVINNNAAFYDSSIKKPQGQPLSMTHLQRGVCHEADSWLNDALKIYREHPDLFKDRIVTEEKYVYGVYEIREPVVILSVYEGDLLSSRTISHTNSHVTPTKSILIRGLVDGAVEATVNAMRKEQEEKAKQEDSHIAFKPNCYFYGSVKSVPRDTKITYITVDDMKDMIDGMKTSYPPYLMEFKDCPKNKAIVLVHINKGNWIRVNGETLTESDINGKFLKLMASEIEFILHNTLLLCTEVW